MPSTGKSDQAWEAILKHYPGIIPTIEDGGIYTIRAEEIKEFREPRLMTKHDTSESVPRPLKRHGINVLPLSRSEYALGNFTLFEKFPDTSHLRPTPRVLPDFQTLTIDNITSEANAINALLAGGILDDFLGSDNTIETFNGRMGTGTFTFNVDCAHGTPATIAVQGAQLEIDGGFENDDSVIIMEAKNVLHDDFHIRQLYYPYRKYLAFVTKPIRLIFSQYTNLTYYLYEYEFTEPDNYNSLKLLHTQAYTLDHATTTADDLYKAWEATPIEYDDDQAHTKIPFIQADRFDRIISLMEQLLRTEEGSMSTEEIAHFMGTTTRQAAYYPAAGQYLGLFTREQRGSTALTPTARHILGLSRKNRQLELAKLMFKHRIFHTLFGRMLTNDTLPDLSAVEGEMLALNVCNSGSTARRRARTVQSWLKWIASVIDA